MLLWQLPEEIGAPEVRKLAPPRWNMLQCSPSNQPTRSTQEKKKEKKHPCAMSAPLQRREADSLLLLVKDRVIGLPGSGDAPPQSVLTSSAVATGGKTGNRFFVSFFLASPGNPKQGTLQTLRHHPLLHGGASLLFPCLFSRHPFLRLDLQKKDTSIFGDRFPFWDTSERQIQLT